VGSNSLTFNLFSSSTRDVTAAMTDVGKSVKKSSILFLVASSPFNTISSLPDNVD
jgi:hypothetical protein